MHRIDSSDPNILAIGPKVIDCPKSRGDQSKSRKGGQLNSDINDFEHVSTISNEPGHSSVRGTSKKRSKNQLTSPRFKASNKDNGVGERRRPTMKHAKSPQSGRQTALEASNGDISEAPELGHQSGDQPKQFTLDVRSQEASQQ